ncbi:membrane protein [Geomonas sp. Red276]
MAKHQPGSREKTGLHIVAVFEAAKGATVLLAGCGLLAFIHKDLHEAAMKLVMALHLNPAKHYPSIFIDAANRVTDLQLWMLALSALIYSIVRFVEAYGLWKQQSWAEWFGLLSGAVYIPMEIFEVSRELTWPRITVLVINLCVVGYLGDVLVRGRKKGENGG